MNNIAVWLVVGSVIGWLASVMMRIDSQQGTIVNVVVGMFGAVVAGWAMSPPTNQNDFSLPALLMSVVGGIGLVGVLRFFRSGSVR